MKKQIINSGGKILFKFYSILTREVRKKFKNKKKPLDFIPKAFYTYLSWGINMEKTNNKFREENII
ncbi:MAG: hypothetical protein ACRCVS_02995 [Fusobacteriaceae bacterium]